MPGTGFRGGSPYDDPVIRRNKTIVAVVAVALGAVVIFLPVIPGQTETSLNRVVQRPPYPASARAAELHRTLVIADLHADTLLWDRDLLTRGSIGHVDVPRLVEGNTALQAFTVVTKVPRGMNIDRNDGESDAVLPLVIAQRWPPRTWWSLKGRALHQARRLDRTSPRLVDDILSAATRPVVVSHTGVTATCDNNRNLTDAQLRRIAANGGIVGIGYFEAAVCETSAASIARAIRHAADVAGIEHVALGSDFDGATVTPFDASGLVQITEALLAEGYSEQEVRLIMGGNVVSLLLRLLPP